MSTRSASILGRRFAHNCVGCGLKLVLPQSRSTLKAKGEIPSVHESADRKISELSKDFSEEQKQASGIEIPEDVDPETDISQRTTFIEQNNARNRAKIAKSRVCKPCIMAREGTETSVNLPNTNFSAEWAAAKEEGQRFWVVNAAEFPLGFPDMSETKKSEDIYVINRCDSLVTHESQSPKLKKYYMDTFFNKYRVPQTRVVSTSASRRWHLKKSSESFVSKPKKNFFFGPTNSGKTRLIHEMSEIPQKNITGGPTTWPSPFSTQESLAYRSSLKYRSKVLVDSPSNPEGSSTSVQLIPSALRKASAGIRMADKNGMYKLPVVKAKTGQIVSIGGLLAVEFPRIDAERQIPVHTFAGIGGLAHTEYARALSSIDKLHEINESVNEAHLKMRIHDNVGLKLQPMVQFHPQSIKEVAKPSIVVAGLGFSQPFVFGDLPKNYKATVWAPQGTVIKLRPEILPQI